MKMKMDYLSELVVYFLWGICVFAIFSLIESKQVAGSVAGMGFLVLPLFFLFQECKQPYRKSKLHIGMLLSFLILSVLPIILIRVFNYGVDFNSLSLFGLPAQQIHKYSNLIYLLIMASAFYHWRLQKSKKT
jgi:hypothetical protein